MKIIAAIIIYEIARKYIIRFIKWVDNNLFVISI